MPGDGERHADAVGPAVAPDGRQHADAHAEDHRPRHAGHGEPERRHEALGDLGADRPLGAQRPAEVAAQRAGDEADELLVQRLVQAEVLADEFDGFRSRVLARGEPRGVARQQVDEQEHQHRDDEQRRGEAGEPLGDVLEHARRDRRIEKEPRRSGRRGSCRRAERPAGLLEVGFLERERRVRHHVDAGELLVVDRQQPLGDEEGPGRVLPDLVLRFLVELRLLGRVGGELRGLDRAVDLGVLVVGGVEQRGGADSDASSGRSAQSASPVERRPADVVEADRRGRGILLALDLLDPLPGLERQDLGLDADLRRAAAAGTGSPSARCCGCTPTTARSRSRSGSRPRRAAPWPWRRRTATGRS